MFLLCLLVAGAVYVYVLIQQQRVENPFLPTPTPTRSATSYAQEAEGLYLEGKLDEAIVVYEQAVALDPDDVLSYIPLARLLALQGRTVEAMRLAQQAVDLASENARAWAVLGMAYDWNGDVAEAIDACQHAIELDPTYAEGYAYLAEAYADAVRWADAIDAIETALELNAYSVDVQRNHGYVLESQGYYEGALAAYEQALTLHPNLAYIHIAAGLTRRALGDYEGAASSLQRVIEIEPGNAEAYDQLGWTYYYMGEYERAGTYLEQAVEADPEFSVAFGHLATNYWTRRNYEDAVPNYERAIELACIEARRQAEEFFITLEESGEDLEGPSPDVVMRGQFVSVSAGSRDSLRATLAPKDEEDEDWADARGTVSFNARTGEYTVELEAMPGPGAGSVFAGWFDGVNALSGAPLSTGPLDVGSDGSLEARFEAVWVEGPRIEYFYTLGLAHFYMAQCERSYLLFDAALQMNPDEVNALEGIRLCREAEAEE